MTRITLPLTGVETGGSERSRQRSVGDPAAIQQRFGAPRRVRLSSSSPADGHAACRATCAR